jgi:hypothetical protein
VARPFEVIALAGRSGAGKDHVARTYFAPRGWRPVAFADHGRVTLVAREQATLEELLVTRPPDKRKLIQEELTERGRHVYGDEVWCRALYTWLELYRARWGFDRFVVTDLRFPAEADYVHRHDGLVYEVHAPARVAGAAMAPALRAHASETALVGVPGLYDGTILNDPEYADAVGTQVAGLLRAHGRG